MKVTYLGHSGFSVEWENCFWIFDYEEGQLPEFPEGKQGLVFVSHKHGDHFNPEIFRWREKYPGIEYILDRGIYLNHRIKELYRLTEWDLQQIREIQARQTYSLEDGRGGQITLKTLKSTDCGVAFLLEYQGRRLYHAGDLNWWLWEGESKQSANNMTASFRRELEQLKGIKLDAAFVPLDPRQGKNAYLGLDALMGTAQVERVFPMHFWNDYSIIGKMKAQPCAEAYRDRIVEIQEQGQSWEI